jgi:hypothetical protein
MKDEIIPATEVVVSPRGRKVEIDPALVAKITPLKAGEALRLAAYFGEIPKDQRSRTSQQIRKHARAAGKEHFRIDYTPEGVPQLRIKPAKG